MRIAILASGNGSNFQAIVEAVRSGELLAEIGLLFCDQKQAYVIERAKKLGIPVVAFSPKDFGSKVEYETNLLQLLEEEEIELLVLAGYMRIVGPTLLNAYPGRMINLHPSLLPDFPGLHGISDAFEAGVTTTGITIHFVDSGIDTGPIIAQEKISVLEADTLELVEEKIHQLEHRVYPQVIAQVVTELKKSKGTIDA